MDKFPIPDGVFLNWNVSRKKYKPISSEIKEILAKHKAWLNGKRDGKANLSNADLSYAYLRNANLNSADLRNANLHDANLSNADLRNTDLRDANLSEMPT